MPVGRVYVCNYAAFSGRLDVLQWAREHGCPWSASTFANAAMYGSLEMLRRLRENGCPWDEWTCAFGRFARASECLAVGAGGSTTARGTGGRCTTLSSKVA